MRQIKISRPDTPTDSVALLLTGKCIKEEKERNRIENLELIYQANIYSLEPGYEAKAKLLIKSLRRIPSSLEAGSYLNFIWIIN